MKCPLNTAPASSFRVSPQAASLSACCRSSDAFTFLTLPGAGVSARELFTCALGNSAGPSKTPEGRFVSPATILGGTAASTITRPVSQIVREFRCQIALIRIYGGLRKDYHARHSLSAQPDGRKLGIGRDLLLVFSKTTGRGSQRACSRHDSKAKIY